MALAKIKDIESTGSECLISGDGGCLMNIAGTMKRNGKTVKALHLYDFIQNRLQGVAI